MDDKFSVLMSVYYKENPEYMRLALKSVIDDQTLSPAEVILVEDGPLTDELYRVIDEFKKKHPDILKTVPIKENGGLGPALNKGLENCSYDLVMRMDTDDIACSDRFAIQVKYMNEHPDVSVLSGAIGEFDQSPDEELRIKKLPLSAEELREYNKFRNPVNHMAACLRKKDILEVGSYQPMVFLEDHYLWERLIVAGKKIEAVPDVLVKARIGNGFYDRRGSKNYIKGWKILSKYMYDNNIVSLPEKIRNDLGMYVLVYCPEWFRKLLYKKILRKN